MEMTEIYNGSQWAHDIFLVNKAGAAEYTTGRSSTLIIGTHSISLLNLVFLKRNMIFFALIYQAFIGTI